MKDSIELLILAVLLWIPLGLAMMIMDYNGDKIASYVMFAFGMFVSYTAYYVYHSEKHKRIIHEENEEYYERMQSGKESCSCR